MVHVTILSAIHGALWLRLERCEQMHCRDEKRLFLFQIELLAIITLFSCSRNSHWWFYFFVDCLWLPHPLNYKNQLPSTFQQMEQFSPPWSTSVCFHPLLGLAYSGEPMFHQQWGIIAEAWLRCVNALLRNVH